tara:strand:- start:314 stop:946 length:633 start_codon:yes stop_codon:yes gene_type:complete
MTLPDTNASPIYGLILAGGHSRRMGKDKAELSYQPDGLPQWLATTGLLSPLVEKTYISVRSDQTLRGADALALGQLLPDVADSQGPLSGILTAMSLHPDAAWLVVACDLPLLTGTVIEFLLRHRGIASALAYRSNFDSLPEPLCTLYEPAMKPVFERYLAADMRCPRKVLIKEADHVQLLDLPQADALDNANTPEDFERLSARVKELVSK